MKLKELRIKNFRGYTDEVSVTFNDFTAFVGKNDIGKSTILEALDIFFNEGKGLIKIDKDDVNKDELNNGNNVICISVIFTDLPSEVIIDESNKTTLKNEFLLNKNNELEVIKKFENGSTTSKNFKVLIKALHPTNPSCKDLFKKKQNDLQKIVNNLKIECEDKRKNAVLRECIWRYYKNDLNLQEVELDVNSKEGEINTIWEQLKKYFPIYSLFQSDRKNSDSDNEIQDPLKESIKLVLKDDEIQEKLNFVAEKVKEAMEDVSRLTLEEVKKLNPEIASSLHPKIPLSSELRWADVFKSISITGDEDIPINKRGSGVKRLILLSFFRAETQRMQRVDNNSNIIYAIEEPETAQHIEHQHLLINALKSLSEDSNAQVIITTHSSDIVKQLKFEEIRIILNKDGKKCIENVMRSCLPKPTLNEVNYTVFGHISDEYHNELYGFLKDKINSGEKGFDDWLEKQGIPKNKDWIKLGGGVTKPAQKRTLQTYIRNFFHHPENKKNKKYTDDELKTSIEQMRRIIKTLNEP